MSDEVTPDPETVSFILEYTKDAPNQQLADVDGLDTKSYQVLGAASIVIGFAGLSGTTIGGGAVVTALLFGALGAYVGVVSFFLRAVRTRDFKGAAFAENLWHDCGGLSVAEAKREVVESIPGVFKANFKLIGEKSGAINRALYCMSAEAILVGTALAVARVR